MWGDESEAVAPIIWLYQIEDAQKEEVFFPELLITLRSYAFAPYWNILAVCEANKEPINLSGFPAPFTPMKMHCCICWYDRGVYYTTFDRKQ